jgi:hypothetical protein
VAKELEHEIHKMLFSDDIEQKEVHHV